MESEQTTAWLRAQDSLARRMIEAAPERDVLLERIRAVSPKYSFSAAQIRGDRYFYTRTFRDDTDARRRVLEFRQGLGGDPQVLIDATEEYGTDARFATYVGFGEPSFQVSPNGRYIAYGVTEGNSRWSRWYVYDTETGEALPDVVDGIHTSAFTTAWWHPNGEGFFYAAYEATPDNLAKPGRPNGPQRVYYHTLYTEGDDTLIFERPDNPDVTHWIWTTDDHLGIDSSDGTLRSVVFRPLDDPAASFTTLVEDSEDALSFVGHSQDELWFHTTVGAPNGRVVSVPLSDPDASNWRTMIPEEQATLLTAYHFGGRLLANYRVDARPEYRIYETSGEHVHDATMPYIGWVQSGFAGRPGDPRVSFKIRGAADPGSLYLLDMQTGDTALFGNFTDTFDADDYVSQQVFYTSRDGTRVPMFLFYRRGLKRDGTNPVWFFAYGSNWSAVPWYQVQHRMLVDMGGIYAIANVRGGGEYGQAWIEAGSGVRRQNAIDDYIAAGEYLIEAGYTSSERLIANGGSASGPLVSAALVQRPDLYGAALISYPYTDMLRYEQFLSPRPVFGTVETREGFETLRRWSPYSNVETGICYPPTLIAHGNEDQLALPLHSYKMAAALQHAQGCSHPVLLQIAWGQGHTVGRAEERANQLAFLVQTLGLTLPDGWE